MSLLVAKRQPMHGPMWEVRQDGPYILVQLWAPNHQRAHWAVGWTEGTTDEDYDSGYEQAATLGEIPALVPARLSRQVGAAINAAQLYDPAERCSHVKAQSFTVLVDGQVCGYCGRLYQPEEEAV